MSQHDECRLLFVEQNDTPKGFASHEQERVNDEIVVRELVQNALDNKKDSEPCRVEFTALTMLLSDIPCIDDYWFAYDNVLPHLREGTSGSRFVNKIDSVRRLEEVDCLLCHDFGTGLSFDGYKSLLSDAATTKTGQLRSTQRGSIGVGHKTILEVSRLRYVLYASNGPDGMVRFGGQAFLATHEDRSNRQKIHRSEHGCVTYKDKQTQTELRLWEDPSPANTAPSWIGLGDEQGTIVCVIAYEPLLKKAKTNWCNNILSWAAKHFFVAISQRDLSVSYSDRRTGKRKKFVELDADTVDEYLSLVKGRKQALRGGPKGLGSGEKAWEAWQTWRGGKSLITDGSLAGAHIKFRDTPGEKTYVTVCRGGMYITDDAPKLRTSDFTAVNPFNAVVDACSGDLEEAMRHCETGSHLKLDVSNRVHPDWKTKLEKLLSEVAELLCQQAGERDEDEWVPEELKQFGVSRSKPAERAKPAPPRIYHQEEEKEDIENVEVEELSDEVDIPDYPDNPKPKPKPKPKPPVPLPPKPDPRRPRRRLKPGNADVIPSSIFRISQTQAKVVWEVSKEKIGNRDIELQVIVCSGSDESAAYQPPNEILVVRKAGTAGSWEDILVVPPQERSMKVEVKEPPYLWESIDVVVALSK